MILADLKLLLIQLLVKPSSLSDRRLVKGLSLTILPKCAIRQFLLVRTVSANKYIVPEKGGVHPPRGADLKLSWWQAIAPYCQREGWKIQPLPRDSILSALRKTI